MSFTVITCVSVTSFSRQWLQIGGFSINMGYCGPILFAVALAGIYDRYDWNNRNNIIKGLLLGIVPLLLVSIANTAILGYFVMYGVTLILLVYMSKAKKKILGLFVISEILILFLTRVGFESVSGFINRWNDVDDSGYIYNQLKIIRDSSVLIGRGVNFELNRLPEFYDDVMFSSIVYSFGWVIGAIVVILIATLLIRIIKVAISVKNSYGKSLVLGITTILGIQFVWNILFNLGLAVGGVSLPFISYSGTSIIINMFLVGIIINIYKGRSMSKVDLISLQHIYEIQKTKKGAQLIKKNNFTFELENMMDSMITTGAFLTSGNKHKANTMTISWGSVGYMWKKPIFIAIVSNSRYTKEFLDQGKNFTISIPYDKDKEKALQFCGHNSGRTVDKETYADIRFIQSKVVDSPIVEGCNRYYECKVVFKQEIDLEKIDSETIYKNGECEHTMYFGEIVEQY